MLLLSPRRRGVGRRQRALRFTEGMEVSGASGFIASDSLGLMRALRDLVGGGIVRTLGICSERTNSSSTRTWDVDDLETKFRALDVIVAMGRSRTLLVAPQKLHCFCKRRLGWGRTRCGSVVLPTARATRSAECATATVRAVYAAVAMSATGAPSPPPYHTINVHHFSWLARARLRSLPSDLSARSAGASAAHLARGSADATPRAKQQLKAASVELAMDGLRRSLGGVTLAAAWHGSRSRAMGWRRSSAIGR